MGTVKIRESKQKQVTRITRRENWQQKQKNKKILEERHVLECKWFRHRTTYLKTSGSK
jgi:hypothetical protein